MVFQGVVKIRKGQAVTLMMEATNMRAAQTIIAQYSQEVSVLLVFGGTQDNKETGTEKTEQREKKSEEVEFSELRNAKVCFILVGADTQMMLLLRLPAM